MLKRPYTIALAVVLLLALILLKLPAGAASRLKSLVSGLFIPLFGLSASAGQAVDKAAVAVTSRAELVRQRDAYARTNDQLRLQLAQADEALRENTTLRQLLNWQKQSPWKSRLARVIAHDPANYWRSVQIDLGFKQGLQLNQPVLAVDGLVGRISAVSDQRATVVLLGDPNLRVSAVIQETRETGVVLSGSAGAWEPDLLDLAYLSRTSNAKAGQTVVTSGDGGIFPRGLLIGHIVDSRSIHSGVSTEARVRLAANLSRLEEVWVIVP